MKAWKRTMLILLVLIVVALLFVTPAAAKVTRLSFTSMETCAPPQFEQSARLWIADGYMQIRGLPNECTDVGSIPQITGANHVMVNATMLLADGTGHLWGKTVFDSNEGGRWAFTWTAQVTLEHTTIKAVGQGQGMYEGQKIFWTLIDGAGTGYILNPHGP